MSGIIVSYEAVRLDMIMMIVRQQEDTGCLKLGGYEEMKEMG